ncbi:hypothetical protein BJX66DRAFT_79574 [Aspergillus keveii]|uniref:Uncharacterized protein n=1 Tax=Aspergillus keveii TaxID=714993 RepID=A0ABR4GF70_9EURO
MVSSSVMIRFLQVICTDSSHSVPGGDPRLTLAAHTSSAATKIAGILSYPTLAQSSHSTTWNGHAIASPDLNSNYQKTTNTTRKDRRRKKGKNHDISLAGRCHYYDKSSLASQREPAKIGCLHYPRTSDMTPTGQGKVSGISTEIPPGSSSTPALPPGLVPSASDSLSPEVSSVLCTIRYLVPRCGGFAGAFPPGATNLLQLLCSLIFVGICGERQNTCLGANLQDCCLSILLSSRFVVLAGGIPAVVRHYGEYLVRTHGGTP